MASCPRTYSPLQQTHTLDTSKKLLYMYSKVDKCCCKQRCYFIFICMYKYKLIYWIKLTGFSIRLYTVKQKMYPPVVWSYNTKVKYLWRIELFVIYFEQNRTFVYVDITLFVTKCRHERSTRPRHCRHPICSRPLYVHL